MSVSLLIVFAGVEELDVPRAKMPVLSTVSCPPRCALLPVLHADTIPFTNIELYNHKWACLYVAHAYEESVGAFTLKSPVHTSNNVDATLSNATS